MATFAQFAPPIDPRVAVAAQEGEWFALQIFTGREQRTAEKLRDRGYPVFLPLFRDSRKRTDCGAVRVTEKALFTGYLFCHFVARELRADVVTTPGVIRIIGSDRPIAIPQFEIDSLQTVIEVAPDARECEVPAVGQRVYVTCGRLTGVHGVVSKAQPDRLVVVITLLNRAVSVPVHPSQVMIEEA